MRPLLVGGTRSRRTLALAAALSVLALDLAGSAAAHAQYFHPRPGAVLALAGLLGTAMLALAPRVPSLGVAVGAGIAAGGAFGTLVAGLAWHAGIPDPIVHAGYAFNLADVAIVAGDAMLLTAAVVHAWDNRGRLRAPV
jgi:lipoprotein signal peptidase